MAENSKAVSSIVPVADGFCFDRFYSHRKESQGQRGLCPIIFMIQSTITFDFSSRPPQQCTHAFQAQVNVEPQPLSSRKLECSLVE